MSELQTQVATNLATQNVHVNNLVLDSLATIENTKRGNKVLRKASGMASVAHSASVGTVVFVAWCLCGNGLSKGVAGLGVIARVLGGESKGNVL